MFEQGKVRAYVRMFGRDQDRTHGGVPNAVGTSQQERKPLLASPWLLALQHELRTRITSTILVQEVGGFSFQFLSSNQSIWMICQKPSAGQLAVRLVYCPGRDMEIHQVREKGRSIEIAASSLMGKLRVQVNFPDPDLPLVHWTTRLVPTKPLIIPFWPRDIYPLNEQGDPFETGGEIFYRQWGRGSGSLLASFSQPPTGSFLYLQNFSSLNTYFAYTHSSPVDRVGGDWPEMGFSLPPSENYPLPLGEEITLSDGYLHLSSAAPMDAFEAAQTYLDLLSEVYIYLPRPATHAHSWIDRAEKSLQDLSRSNKTRLRLNMAAALAASYVGEKSGPADLTTQIEVFDSLSRYEQWRGKKIPLVQRLEKSISLFENSGNPSLPGQSGQSFEEAGHDTSGQAEVSRITRSFYRSLYQLADHGLRGSSGHEPLLQESIEIAIQAARHFHYRWPEVFQFDPKKRAFSANELGEQKPAQVGGIYIGLMVRLYRLTGDREYLREAERAARSVDWIGARPFQNPDDAAVGALALLQLYQETGNTRSQALSIYNLAHVLHTVWFWESDYGYAADYPTFLGIPQTPGGDTLSVQSESMVFDTIHDYLRVANGAQPAGLQILIPELLRYLANGLWYFYPSQLPQASLPSQPVYGAIDPGLDIPLEDLSDGWQQAGRIGQSIPGASAAFRILANQYRRFKGAPFIVYCDYPLSESAKQTEADQKIVKFRILGNEQFTCRLRLIPLDGNELSQTRLLCRGEEDQEMHPRRSTENHLEYWLPGSAEVSIYWSG